MKENEIGEPFHASVEPLETFPVQCGTDDRFAITDEGKANWLLRKLADIDAEKNRIKAQTAQRVSELDADAERLKFQFGQQLEQWAKSEADRRRRKTITLQQGTLCLRTVPARFTVSDGEAAFCHARTALPDAIKTTVTLDTAAYIKAATESGERLPGLDAIPLREAFTVKFPGAKGTGE